MTKHNYILVALVAAMTFAACNKQSTQPLEKPEPGKLIVNAKFPESFDDSRKAALIEISSKGPSGVIASEKTISRGDQLQFKFPIDTTAAGTAPYTYITVFPSTSMKVVSNTLTLSVPAEQTFSADKEDTESVVYYDITTVQGARPATLDVVMNGLGCLMKVNIANLPPDEIIRNVAVVSASGAALSGSQRVDLKTGAVTTGASVSTSINAAPEKGAERAGTVRIRTLPVAAGSYNITLVTDKSIFKWNGVPVGDIVPGIVAEVDMDVASAIKQDELRILLLGNSFTQDACHQLPPLLCGFAPIIGPNGFKVTLCQMYYGGRTVSVYNEGWDTASDYTRHLALPGDNAMTDKKNMSVKDVANSGRWDIVTIQEHSGGWLGWIWNDAERRSFDGLIKKVCATQEVRPQLYYIFSQSYYDQSKIGSGSVSYVTWTDHKGMFEVTSAFAQHVMEEFPFVDVIPTGTMLENLRETSLMNEMGLTRDGFHMDYGISRYGAACCCYMQMIYPRCGELPLSANPYRSSASSSASGSIRTPITDENAPIAQKAALDAIASPWKVTTAE